MQHFQWTSYYLLHNCLVTATSCLFFSEAACLRMALIAQTGLILINVFCRQLFCLHLSSTINDSPFSTQQDTTSHSHSRSQLAIKMIWLKSKINTVDLLAVWLAAGSYEKLCHYRQQGAKLTFLSTGKWLENAKILPPTHGLSFTIALASSWFPVWALADTFVPFKIC